MSDADKADWSNLVLLCANCHTTIDKAEASYPIELLRAWKRDHLDRIDRAFGTGPLKSRGAVYDNLYKYRLQNRAIFDAYGPLGEDRFNPESAKPRLWRQHIRETILPNNRAMLRLMDQNASLATEVERRTMKLFRMHVREFEARHIQDYPTGSASRYPSEVDNLFSDEARA